MNAVLSPIARFWKLLFAYKPEIYQIYLYAILSGLVNLSLPLGIQSIINLIQGNQISTSWFILVGFVLLGIALTGIFQVFQLRIVEKIQQDIFARSAFEFTFRVPRIKLLKLDNVHAPELVNRFFDTLTIQKSLPKILIDFSLASFQVIFGLLLLAIYSYYFIFLGLFLCLLLLILFKITGQQGLNTSLKESKHKYQLAHWLEETARTHKSFKLGADTTLHLQKTDDIAVQYLESRGKHFKVLLTQFKYFVVCKIIVAAALLILGSVLVFQEQMNLGQFVASEIMVILIINSIEKLIRSMDTIYDVLTALEKIGYVTDLDLEETEGIVLEEEDNGISIEVSNLEFIYPDAKENVLNGLSFTIDASAKVIIEGKSGSGKSTLLHLLTGLYDATGGVILLNEIPLYKLQKQALYPNIGLYLPTNQLFEGTIWENITLGRNISDKQMAKMLAILGLKKYIAHQIGGIQTRIDPEGRRLPRGIAQKILIARTLIHQPRLLVMEDPLQFLEEEEKHKIVDYIMDEQQKWTVIVITDYPYWKTKSNQIVRL